MGRNFILASVALAAAALAFVACAKSETSAGAPPAASAGPPSPFPTAVPGSAALGTWAPTAQPANTGAAGDKYNDAPAVAVWDLPDYIDLNAPSPICVYANHLNGIDHVDIAINGGAFTTAAHVDQSPNGPEPAYCVTAGGAAVADGNAEVRAIAYPVSGVPLVLQGAAPRDYTHSLASLFLSFNNHGTLFHQTYYVYATGTDSKVCGADAAHACATASQAMENAMAAGHGDLGGATICFGPNPDLKYFADSNNGFATAHRYLTWTPCPGVDKGQVVFTSADLAHGIRTSKVHLKGLTMVSTPAAVAKDKIANINAYGITVFLEDFKYVGQGKGQGAAHDTNEMITSAGAVFGRDVDISRTGDGFGNCSLAVRIRIHDISSDTFSGCFVVLQPAGDMSYIGNDNDRYTPPGSTAWVTGNTHSNTLIDGIRNTSEITVGSIVRDQAGSSECFPGDYFVTAVTANSVTVDKPVKCSEKNAVLMTGDHPDVFQNVEVYLKGHGQAGDRFFTMTAGKFYVNALIQDTIDLPDTPDSPRRATPVFAPFTRVLAYDRATGVVTLSKPLNKSFDTATDRDAQGGGTEIYTGRSNMVLYGVTAATWQSTQGIFQGSDMADIVVDHVLINNRVAAMAPDEPPYNWHGGGHWENALFDASRFVGPNSLSIWGHNMLVRNTACGGITHEKHVGIDYVGDKSCAWPPQR